MTFQIRVASTFLVLIFAWVSAGLAEELSPRAYVVDNKPPSVSAVSLENGQILGTVQLTGKPSRMVVSPDGRRIIVLDKGKGETNRFGYHPKAKSVITLIDTATIGVVATAEVGWGVSTGSVLDRQGFGGSWVFSPDGRFMTIACFGYLSQKPKEALPAELVTLDLENGEVVRRRQAGRPIDALITTRDASLAVVYGARREGKKKQSPLKAALGFVDLSNLEVLAKVSLKGEPGPPVLSPDGD